MQVIDQFPSGWFAVAFSDDVTAGQIFTGRLAGEDVVVYRTRSGQLNAVRPHCPHLGAHLGRGGRVTGEEIVCPFHAFAFDLSGACVRTSYDKPPPRASLTRYPVLESLGLIFVWRHTQGKPPDWTPATAAPVGSMKPLVFQKSLGGHPYDGVENLIDSGHFKILHDTEVSQMKADFDGPLLNYSSTFTGFFRGPAKNVQAHMNVQCSGLGHIFVATSVRRLGVEVGQMVGLTPEDTGVMRLRVSTAAKIGSGRGWRPALEWPLAQVVKVATQAQISADYRIFPYRKYTEHPKLAVGDGPIMAMRRWAQQFYEDRDGSPASGTRAHEAAGDTAAPARCGNMLRKLSP